MARNDYGNRYVGTRVPAWHNGGLTVTDREITCVEGLELADMNFPYVKAPIGYTMPDGNFVHSNDKSMVLRGPSRGDSNWAELGIVNDTYHFLQNADLATGLDKLATATGWKFDTCGALGKGETVWFALRTGQASVFGDAFDMFVAVVDGKCSNRALNIQIDAVRRVCENTVLAGDKSGGIKINVPHDVDVSDNFNFWLSLVQQIEESHRGMISDLETMASVKINEKQAMQIIATAMPMPKKSERAATANRILEQTKLTDEQRAKLAAQVNRTSERNDYDREWFASRRLIALDLYNKISAGTEISVAEGGKTIDADTLAQISNTPYAVVQAVAELADFVGSANARVAATASLFGQNAEWKKRSYDAALNVATRELAKAS